MADPLARSPIRPADPALAAGWEVSSRRSDADLRITDCTPLAKVAVRASAGGPFAQAVGVRHDRVAELPRGWLAAGFAPGEWLLLGRPGGAGTVVVEAGRLVGDDFATVIDVTHAHALVELAGVAAADVLAKVCAIDFSEAATPNGTALRSLVAKLTCEIVRDDGPHGERRYLLACERSSGQYLFDVLCEAGAEFGLEVDGFRNPLA